MPAIAASAVRIPKDARVAKGIEIPKSIKHPKKVQAIAKVMCHSHFGFHRLAIINNSLVLFDHNLVNEEEWKELGGKESRCSATLRCFKEQRMSGVPTDFRPYMEAAKMKRYQRRIVRHREWHQRRRLAEGGDFFSKMRRYVQLVLKHRCNYESIRKADFTNLDISMSRTKCVIAEGKGLRKLDIYTSPNAAKRTPMVVDLRLDLVKGWRKKISNLAMTSIEGHLILEIHGRTSDKFKTFVAQVLVEKVMDLPDADGCHREWHFEKKWTTIQHRNGFWYMGELADRHYEPWRPKGTKVPNT